jgi:nicotinamidase-related amidase
MTAFDPRTTALVLIDLQNGIVAMPVQPRSGPDVLATGKALAEKFRAAKAPVVLVNVAFAPDFADAPPSNVDQPLQGPPGGLPPDWSKLADGLAQPSDLRVTKKQWGAFTGTDLDLQLRRRGIRTMVLGGIATNIGVESTARFAWELGYDIAVVEDACTAMAAEQHEMSFRAIFPRIARVVRSADVAFARA